MRKQKDASKRADRAAVSDAAASRDARGPQVFRRDSGPVGRSVGDPVCLLPFYRRCGEPAAAAVHSVLEMMLARRRTDGLLRNVIIPAPPSLSPPLSPLLGGPL